MTSDTLSLLNKNKKSDRLSLSHSWNWNEVGGSASGCSVF